MWYKFDQAFKVNFTYFLQMFQHLIITNPCIKAVLGHTVVPYPHEHYLFCEVSQNVSDYSFHQLHKTLRNWGKLTGRALVDTKPQLNQKKSF